MLRGGKQKKKGSKQEETHSKTCKNSSFYDSFCLKVSAIDFRQQNVPIMLFGDCKRTWNGVWLKSLEVDVKSLKMQIYTVSYD